MVNKARVILVQELVLKSKQFSRKKFPVEKIKGTTVLVVSMAAGYLPTRVLLFDDKLSSGSGYSHL